MRGLGIRGRNLGFRDYIGFRVRLAWGLGSRV